MLSSNSGIEDRQHGQDRAKAERWLASEHWLLLKINLAVNRSSALEIELSDRICTAMLEIVKSEVLMGIG